MFFHGYLSLGMDMFQETPFQFTYLLKLELSKEHNAQQTHGDPCMAISNTWG